MPATTTPTPKTPAQRRNARRAQTIHLVASLRHAWLACHEPETLRRQAAQRAAATRAAKRETILRAAVIGAYAACDYRTAGGRWAGGEHNTTVVIVREAVAGPSAAEVAEAALVAERARIWLDAAARWARTTDENEALYAHAHREYHALLEARRVATAAPTSPSASGDSTRAWSRNGKWSGLNSSHRLTVRPDWRARVEARGLAVAQDGADRRLVLDCDEVRGPLAHVLVVLPSRGFDLRTEWRWVEVPSAQSVEVRQ